jgi:hypothetical protein
VTYKVLFSVKRTENPDRGYIIEKVKEFTTALGAMRFSRAIRSHISSSEELIGKPLLQDAA